MAVPSSLPHRYKLSDTGYNLKPLSTTGLHQRLAKRLSDVYKRTRDTVQVKLNSTSKKTWNASSNDGCDDDAPIDHHKPYNAVVVLFNPGYLRAGNLFPARLRTPKNFFNAHSGHQVDSGPALRIGPLPTSSGAPQALGTPSTEDHYRAAKGESSSQKRPPASPGKSGSNSKKQRKESRHLGDGDPSGNNEDDEGDPSLDGPHFPWPKTSPHNKTIPCPFYQKHPARYDECKGHRIKSISYVIQHILRCHLLKVVKMGVQNTDQSANGNPTDMERTTDPNKIRFYCPTCRDGFRGVGADKRLKKHTCSQVKSIAETGMLLPEEFGDLKSEVHKVSGTREKWAKIWMTLFPGTPVPSPYNETEDVAQPNNDFQPIPSAVNETHHHDPPQGFLSQMPDCIQTWDGAGFLGIPYELHWNDIGNLDHAGNLISNHAPTDLQPTGPAPNCLQPLISKSTQNPTFPSNDWPQSEYHSRQ
ncbi:ankyrin protein [Fusarium napiforme]|uniref:Ankyrin protein n=1 Tax=Fusarium napiforme TaxID=42672 RepID=A0A8H5JS23_9HYPO|nr:ankyrin protein [Fusarium napiforme]